MARLAVAIRRDFPQYYKFFRVKSFRYGKRVHRNHNKLLRRYASSVRHQQFQGTDIITVRVGPPGTR